MYVCMIYTCIIPFIYIYIYIYMTECMGIFRKNLRTKFERLQRQKLQLPEKSHRQIIYAHAKFTLKDNCIFVVLMCIHN